MIGKNKFTKSVIIIIHNKLLRVIGLLNLIMIFGVIALCVINYSYNNKIQASMNEIQTSKQLEQSLKAVAQPAEIAQVQQDETSILTKKSFAKYEEVIPFVAILENLFSAIDQESEISLKSKEDEMYVNHYADYTASLKMDSDKKLLFFQVFDELYNSQFITDVIDFSISYSPESESNPSELNRAEIIIRLYLN
jgi:hypothetical protein